MIPLPACRWRGEVHDGDCVCASPKFVAPPNLVAHDFCRNCYYVDHGPAAPLPRTLPCVHLGGPTGETIKCPTCKGNVQLKVHACAVHGKCLPTHKSEPRLVRDCHHCPDYLQRAPQTPDSGQMRSKADAFLAAVPDYPTDRYAGRGIVIAGGGERFFAALYVTIRAVRHVGCRLPIQVWYLGRNHEMPADRQALLAPHGVACVDADEVRLQHPARRLDGWELKVFATLHSPFAEVLFLDADCYPCRNPEFLFDDGDYATQGAIFWPDIATIDTRLKWPAFGVADPRRPGSVESGQYVIDKRSCWRPLNLAWFYNDYSDYYYRYCYGDKHTFEVAWTRCARPFVMWQPEARWQDVAYLHPGPDGTPLFVHRCADKFRFERQQYVTNQNHAGTCYHPHLPLENECWQFLAELADALGRNRLTAGPVACELRRFERRVHSQNGEDGIIAEILRRTQTQGLAVELGAHCEYGNCYRLAEQGYATLFIERDADRLQRLASRINGPCVSYKLVHVTVENANLAVPADTMILSIDIDGNDYWIWQVLACRPEVVIIEFNLVHPPPERKVVPYDPKFCWDGTDYYGASLSALYELGRRKGYVLVGTDSVQCNAYFVLERFADRFVPVTPEQVWFTPTWRHAVSERKMVDVK
jgi:hypothetical protein